MQLYASRMLTSQVLVTLRPDSAGKRLFSRCDSLSIRCITDNGMLQDDSSQLVCRGISGSEEHAPRLLNGIFLRETQLLTSNLRLPDLRLHDHTRLLLQCLLPG